MKEVEIGMQNPTALPNLIAFQQIKTTTQILKRNLKLLIFPVMKFTITLLFFITGHGNIFFSEDAALNLKNYLISGGFLQISDNYGLDPYIRKEMKKVFPELEFQEIPLDHAIYHPKI